MNHTGASRELGVDVEGICGEWATCGKYRVRIERGSTESGPVKPVPMMNSPVRSPHSTSAILYSSVRAAS